MRQNWSSDGHMVITVNICKVEQTVTKVKSSYNNSWLHYLLVELINSFRTAALTSA